MTMTKDEQIEEKFREVASNTVDSSSAKLMLGEIAHKMSEEDTKYKKQTLLNEAGEKYAFASEIALKASIVYDDFRKNPRFIQDTSGIVSINGKDIECYGIGTSEWKESLAAEKNGDTRILDDPGKVLKLIKENDGNDRRSLFIVTSENRTNSTFKSLKYDDEPKVNGHMLYPYYQLLSDVAKSLVNTEYYCYVDEAVNYTIYALLTEDILTTNKAGETILPQDFMEDLHEMHDKSVELRYAGMSGHDINERELVFLHEFAQSTIAVSEYRFRLPKEYGQIDWARYDYNSSKYKGFSFFDGLDRMQKFDLLASFKDTELNLMINHINKLTSNAIPVSDIYIFISNCIYLKKYVNEKLNINLEFGPDQLRRIENFCEAIKAYQLFNSNSKRLSENPAVKAQKSEIITKIVNLQAQKQEELAAKQEENSIKLTEKQQEEVFKEKITTPVEETDPRKISINHKYNLLLEFYEEKGRMPKAKEQYKGENLGIFLSDIKNGHVSLSEEQKNKLLELDSNAFSTKNVEGEKNKKLSLLLEFYKENNRWPKQKEQYKGENLGIFLSCIKIGDISLSEDQKKELLELDPNVFENSRKIEVTRKYDLLLEFYEEKGRWPTQKEQYKGENIGNFLSKIKIGHTSLTEEQKQQLLELAPDVFENNKNVEFTEKQIQLHNMKTLNKGLLANLEKDQLKELTDKYFRDENNELHCAYSGKTIKSQKELALDNIIPVNKSGNSVLFNVCPTMQGINANKSDSDLLTWWKNQEYYDVDRLRNLTMYMIEAYDKIKTKEGIDRKLYEESQNMRGQQKVIDPKKFIKSLVAELRDNGITLRSIDKDNKYGIDYRELYNEIVNEDREKVISIKNLKNTKEVEKIEEKVENNRNEYNILNEDELINENTYNEDYKDYNKIDESKLDDKYIYNKDIKKY